MGVWMYEEAGDSVEEDSGQAAMVVGEGQAFCSVRCSTCPAMCGHRAPGSVHRVGAVSGRSGNLGTSLNLSSLCLVMVETESLHRSAAILNKIHGCHRGKVGNDYHRREDFNTEDY